MSTVLELRALTKHFPTHRAVSEVSLEIKKGEFFSLLGPSGCGKTTTLRLIAGLEEPTSGDIFLDGSSLRHQKPYERNVSTVFQSYALFPHLTVARNVAFGLEHSRTQRITGKTNIGEKVTKMLSLMQLSGKEARYPHELSGGERQRVALARSLVLEPAVLLLDEPLSALDPQLRMQMRSELKRLQRQVGITFVFITHDQEEALSLSDRIAVMNGGRIEQVGTPRELYFQPASRFVASFLGTVNWVDGAAIRPEYLRLSRVQPVNGARWHPAVVRSSTFLGNCIHVETVLPDGSSCVAELTHSEEEYYVGEAVHIWWHTQDELPISVAKAASAAN